MNIEMEAVVEELQLLGLLDERLKHQKRECSPHINRAVRGLLDLYHQTFEEKIDLQESVRRQAAEIRDLTEANYKLEVSCSRQATLVSNLKFKEENLLSKVDSIYQEHEQLRKKIVEERLKWQRRSQLERVALQKAHQEVSSLKDELRKVMYSASTRTKRNGELLVEGGSIQILNNHLRVDRDIHEKKKTLKEKMLGKSIKRLDASQRVLVEESATICSSLQAINLSVQQAINALKIYIIQEDKHMVLDSLKYKNEIDDDEVPMLLPLLVTNIHQMCVQLNELVQVLLRSSSCPTMDVAGCVMRKYCHSFSKYESVLDSALESICLK